MNWKSILRVTFVSVIMVLAFMTVPAGYVAADDLVDLNDQTVGNHGTADPLCFSCINPLMECDIRSWRWSWSWMQRPAGVVDLNQIYLRGLRPHECGDLQESSI